MGAWRRVLVAWLVVTLVTGWASPCLQAQTSSLSADERALTAEVQDTLATVDELGRIHASALEQGDTDLASRVEARLQRYRAVLEDEQKRLAANPFKNLAPLRDLVGTALREPLFGKATDPSQTSKRYDGLSLGLGRDVAAMTTEGGGANVVQTFSMVYARDIVSQLSQNNWNPTKVDWNRKFEAMKTPSFWGGVAGAVAGALAGGALAAMIPGGGALASVLRFSIAASAGAVGCQIGSGGALNAIDWPHFWAFTAGATLGRVVGAACFGPVGAWVGAFVGGFVGDWALRVYRGWSAARHAAEGRAGDAAEGRGSSSSSSPTVAGSSDPTPASWAGGSVTDLARERDQIMVELTAALEARGADPANLQRLLLRKGELDRELARARSAAGY